MRTYRGSEAPLSNLCAGSCNAPPEEIAIDSVNPAGAVGTVVHSICEHMVDHDGRLPLNWQETCRAHGLDAATKEVGQLVFAAKAFWDQNKGGFPGAKTEVPLNFDVMSGHVDVLSIGEKTATILDWKTTRLDIDYTPQMLFYAWLVMLNNPDIYSFVTAVVFLRDRTANIKEWTKEQILGFEARYTQQVINWDGRTYRPGGHCAYCKRFASCPAQEAMVKQTVNGLTNMIEPGGNLVGFYQRVKVVETMVTRAKELVRATVERAGGELHGLKLVPSSRDTIDAEAAWPVILAFHQTGLAHVITTDDLSPAVAINKGPLMEIVGNHALPRQKGKAIKAMTEALEKAGALTKTEFTVLKVVQSKETEVKEIGNGTETE